MNRFFLGLLICTGLAACGGDSRSLPQPLPSPLSDTTGTSLPFSDVPTDTSNVALPFDTTPRSEKPKRLPAQAQFETTRHVYGTIRQDSVVTYTFRLKNIGEMPLEINDVKASCGCTIASFNFLPILPNESSEIKAQFNSKGKSGKQKSTLTVLTNGTPAEYVLTLEGEVKQ